MRTIVLAAHPDDEVLGCGGTIASLCAAKTPVRVVIFGTGIASRGGKTGNTGVEAEIKALRADAERANALLGVNDLHFADFPDNQFDTVPLLTLVKEVERQLSEFRPERILTHCGSDVNVDHRVLHEAVLTGCRPIPGQKVKEVLFFEIASSTEWNFTTHLPAFQPRLYQDISATLPQKLESLRAYKSEMRPWPHSRSVEALEHRARLRGSEVGVEAAEAFMVGRLLR